MASRSTRTAPRPRAHEDGRGSGARAADPQRPHRRRGGWLWWLLGLLALALIVAALVGAFSGDSGDDGQGQGQNSSAGLLRAGDTSLLPIASQGLERFTGETAEGREIVVQSVVRNAEDPDALEGFWVGSGRQDRVYVEWGGDVGENEADYTPEVGERVNLTGPVEPAPANPEEELNLNGADARLVRRQGAFVNADEVDPIR